MKLLRVLGAALCLAVVASQGWAAPRASRDMRAAERFVGDVDSLRVASHIPGLSVAVLRDTAVVLARGGIFFGDFEFDSQVITLRHIMSMSANGTPGTRFWYNPVAYSWASRPIMQVSKE